MAFPAFGLLPNFLAARQQLCRRFRRPPDVERLARRLLDEEGVGLVRIAAVHRQLVLDVLQDGEAVVDRHIVPGRHCRAANAAGDRAHQIAVGRQRPLDQAELEHRQLEVARPELVHEGRSRAVAIARDAMAAGATPPVYLLAMGDPLLRARHTE
jgi:hypothetical protein